MNKHVEDPGHISTSTVENLFASLAIPVTDINVDNFRLSTEQDGFTDNIHPILNSVITEVLAEKVWSEWYPGEIARVQQPKFRKAFTRLLSECAALGFSLNHLRESSRNLPDPDETAKNWISTFEGSINGKENFGVRLYLNDKDYREYSQELREKSEDEKSWYKLFKLMADGLFYETGIFYPEIIVKKDETLSDFEIRIEWNDLILPPQYTLAKGQVLVNDTVDGLLLLNIKGKHAINPANGNECAIVNKEYADDCEKAGMTTWDKRGYIILKLSSAIRSAAGCLVNRNFSEYLLNSLSKAFPVLCDEFGSKFELDFFTQIIRGLIQEEISIRNLRAILDALLSVRSVYCTDLSKKIVFKHNVSSTLWARKGKDISSLQPIDFVITCRISLKRYISHKYTRGQSTLVVYLIDPSIEQRLRQKFPLVDEEREELLHQVGSLPPATNNPVILTTEEIRRRLWNELRLKFPRQAVLCYEELSPEMNIQPIARIHAEVQPIDESLYRFFLTLPELTEVSDTLLQYPEIILSEQENEVLDILRDKQEIIINSISTNAKEMAAIKEMLNDLIGRFIYSYKEFIERGQLNYFENLLQQLVPALTVVGVKSDDISRFVSLISQELDRLLRVKYTENKEDNTLDKLNKALEVVKNADDQMCRKFSSVLL